MIKSQKIPIFVDAHVHIQSIYNLSEYFDHVFYNFSEAAKKLDGSNTWIGFLLLTEVIGINQFENLKRLQIVGNKQNYSIQLTEENNSLKIISESGNKIFVIAGKQIIAKDNIEVLALATEKNFEEGQDIIATLKKINNNNGIAVLPWGVGKWTCKRKEIVEKFLIEHKDEKFFLGDNSGRPKFWNEPQLFKIGNKTKHFVLPGSDALAIPSEVNKTASYGFYTYSDIDEKNPTESIKDILKTLNKPPNYFGKLENPFSFFKNQLTMQLLKRTK